MPAICRIFRLRLALSCCALPTSFPTMLLIKSYEGKDR
jgi:hypothetical protein